MEILHWFLLFIGFLVSLAGIIGCILPIIPGPPLSFLALLLLMAIKGWDVNLLIVMGIITIAVTVMDYIVPAAGAKKYGASKAGVWGSVVGMLIGLVFFPPWGLFIGAFLGAVVGEMLVGKHGKNALKAGWGVFVGTLLAIVLKLAACVTMFYFYIEGLL
ncbi:DUF456 domain-containing protein [candidate division KSB1 bacterium]|nr:DUF456 domain-containing protein [candidate division KSB1 bacterium]